MSPARAALVLAWTLGCAHARAPRAPPDFALTRETAAEVCLPRGEEAWLKALRCPGGEPPRTERQGSAGARNEMGPDDGERALLQLDPGRPLERGERDLHGVDAFSAACGARVTTIYLDMYHCGAAAPRVAPEGFGIGDD